MTELHRLFLIGVSSILYLVIINLIGFSAFYIDKRAAQNQESRISESNLLLISLLGGSLGCIAAQQKFRHKTRKQPFKFQLQMIVVLQISFVVALCIPESRGFIFEAFA